MSGTVYNISFCNDLPPKEACKETDQTMVVANFKDVGCKVLSGSSPTSNAVFSVDDLTLNNGL